MNAKNPDWGVGQDAGLFAALLTALEVVLSRGRARGLLLPNPGKLHPGTLQDTSKQGRAGLCRALVPLGGTPSEGQSRRPLFRGAALDRCLANLVSAIALLARPDHVRVVTASGACSTRVLHLLKSAHARVVAGADGCRGGCE